MAVVEPGFTAMREAPEVFGNQQGSPQDQVPWTEEPALLGDYAIFLGALVVSFGLLGLGFWALVS